MYVITSLIWYSASCGFGMLVAVAIFAWVVERKARRDSAVVSELLAITSKLGPGIRKIGGAS